MARTQPEVGGMTAKAKEHAADMRLKKRPAKIATKYRKLEEKQRNAHRNKLEKQRKAYHKLREKRACDWEEERKIRSTTLIGQPTSSSAHVPVIQTLCAQCADGGYYEFHWTEGKAYTNKAGTVGWATVTHTTNTAVMSTGPGVRIHLCANDPCSNLFPMTKFGLIPPPMHLREVPKQRQLSAVAVKTF
jgi:hypothetical protein